jgi:hypothetical protein
MLQTSGGCYELLQKLTTVEAVEEAAVTAEWAALFSGAAVMTRWRGPNGGDGRADDMVSGHGGDGRAAWTQWR